MARLLAETTWGCSIRCRKASLSILAVALGIAFSGCNRPAAPAAAAPPPEQSKTLVEPTPAPELVEVWVAARDLPVGTVVTRDELPRLAVRKKLPKDKLPSSYVASLEEYVDKKLTQIAHKDAVFDPHSFSDHKVLRLPEGLSLVDLPIPMANVCCGVPTPGSKADVLATVKHKNRLVAFRLLADVLVLDVDTSPTNSRSLPVSLALTQEQVLVLSLAKQRDCMFEVLPRVPGVKADLHYDIKQVKDSLQDDRKLATFLKAKADPSPSVASNPEPIESPRELVEVWVAVSDIPPKTVITRQLVDAKLKRTNVSKERAEGAISDLTNLLDQEWTLVSGLRQGQWLTASLVGPPQPTGQAVSEQVEVAPMPRVVKPKKYKDVTITTPSGTRIYRYEEVAPGKDKFVGEFAPEDTRKATVRVIIPPKKRD